MPISDHLAPSGRSGPAPIRLLLVEDNPVDARLITIYLKQGLRAAHVLTECAYLDEALRLVCETAFDAIILDLSLPDCSGYTTFTRMWEAASEIPIVILTGTEDESIALQAIQAGAQDYLPKGSLTSTALGRTIRYGIERRALQKDVVARDRQLLMAHKLESLGQLSAGIAHEINTPLQFIGDNLQFISDQIAPLLETMAAYARVVEAHRDAQPDSPL
ncbi:MAG: response regulator, partial [Planctomycetes bacterium]|nr:response regulator [Planctomycetota bacterium]